MVRQALLRWLAAKVAARVRCAVPPAGGHLVGNNTSLSFAKWICTQRCGGRAVSTHARGRAGQKLRQLKRSGEATVSKIKELRKRSWAQEGIVASVLEAKSRANGFSPFTRLRRARRVAEGGV